MDGGTGLAARAARPVSSPRRSIAVVAACPLPAPRGTPVRILRLSEALAARGHDVHVVTYHLGDGAVSDRVRLHRIPEVPTYRKMSPGPSWQKLLVLDPLLAATLRRVLDAHRVDLIHAHHYEGLLAALVGARDRTLPVVYDAHTLLGSELPTYRLGLPRAWLRAAGLALDAHLPRLADRVIAVTESIAGRLAELGVDSGRIAVASNGIEPEFFRARQARDRAGAERIAFAGNLASYQRVDLLLDAFRRVREARPGVRLSIFTRSRFGRYEDRARTLGVLGAVDVVGTDPWQIPSRLSTVAVAVNPRTECDGIPLKLLNYMAASCAIASFAGSAPVLRHGETGLLAEDGDPQALAAAILELLGDPERAERFGRNARAFVRRHHGWPQVAARVEEVYTAALAVRGSSGEPAGASRAGVRQAGVP